MAIFSRLIPCAVSALTLQLGLAAVFVPLEEDRFYDLSGAAGFVTTTLVSVLHPVIRARLSASGTPVPCIKLLSQIKLAPRQLLLTMALFVWTGRLGSFLFRRAMREGGDSRLTEMKHQKGKFIVLWIAQAVWVFVVGLPVYMCNAVPASAHSPLRALDYATSALAVVSFTIEATADRQKCAWRAARDKGLHRQKFITTGLWGISRHPKYVQQLADSWGPLRGWVLTIFGSGSYAAEVGIWTGMWALSGLSGALSWQAVAASACSPLLTYVLLRHISGIPALERDGDQKWGDDPKWKEYKQKVPILFPWGGYV